MSFAQFESKAQQDFNFSQEHFTFKVLQNLQK